MAYTGAIVQLTNITMAYMGGIVQLTNIAILCPCAPTPLLARSFYGMLKFSFSPECKPPKQNNVVGALVRKWCAQGKLKADSSFRQTDSVLIVISCTVYAVLSTQCAWYLNCIQKDVSVPFVASVIDVSASGLLGAIAKTGALRQTVVPWQEPNDVFAWFLQYRDPFLPDSLLRAPCCAVLVAHY